MKILLACAGGMSTSILMKNMEKYAAEQGIEPFEIAATSTVSVKDYAADGYDCVLVGPQVRYQIDEVRAASGLPCEVIPTEDYGNANCEAVMALAQQLIASAPKADAEAASASAAEAPAAEPAPAAPSSGNALLDKLSAFGAGMQRNPVVNAITSGMMGTMGLILAGAVFSIIAALGSLLGFIPAESALYAWLQLPYNMCMNAMALPVAFGVAYVYTKNLGKKGEVANGFVSMILFLIVAAPFQTVELADGSTMTVMDTTYLGGTGIFTALIMPIIVVNIIAFCQDHNVTVKMPDVVPPFLSEAFGTLIPLLANILLWYGLNTACTTFMGAPLPAIIMGILSIPLAPLTSAPGVIILNVLGCVFWCLGIHGSAITYIVLMAPMMAAYATNAELVAAGQAAVFNPVFLMGALACCGGTGNTLPLAVHCLRAKSEQLKAIGKASAVPALFNISEPIVFGLPIMYNPIIDIPFILNVLITSVLVWVGYATGFLAAPSLMILTVMPIGVAEFLTTMSWHNVLVPVVAFVVGYLVYAPFVRIYDQQCLAKEAAKAEQAA